MAFYPSNTLPQQFETLNGFPAVGWYVVAFIAGTSTRTNMFTDAVGTVAGTKVQLNARGEPEVSGNAITIFLDDGVDYKLALYNGDPDTTGASVYTIDDVADGRFGSTFTLEVNMIMLWAGAISSLPAKWALCDGSLGTPDLRDRFVVGAGLSYSQDDTGGSDTQTTNSSGPHTHTLTIAGHALTEAEMPAHTHDDADITNYQSGGTGRGNLDGGGATDILTQQLASTGGGATHTHTGSTADSAGSEHTHTLDNRPKYYALAYIMYIG